MNTILEEQSSLQDQSYNEENQYFSSFTIKTSNSEMSEENSLIESGKNQVALCKKLIQKQDQSKSLSKKGRKAKCGKQVQYGIKQLMNMGSYQLFEQKDNNNMLFYKVLPIQKCYFLAGDIMAELVGRSEEDVRDLFFKNRNVISVESANEAISVEFEISQPIKHLQQVIHYLENSQDKESYDFAQHLKVHQKTVYMLNDSVQQLKDQYLSSSLDLVSVIQERKNFAKQFKKGIVKELFQNDEFACVATVSISYTNQTSTMSHMSITKPAIALLGLNENDLPFNLIKMGFLKQFDIRTRRKIFQSNIQVQAKSGQGIEIEVPDFEVNTMDNIKITCLCKVMSIPIQYPSHLQFNLDQNGLLDQIECLVAIRYIINPSHIEQILKIRKEYIFQAPQNKVFPKNYEYDDFLELENFEYNMQNEIFLEKYYKEQLDKIKSQNQEKNENLNGLHINNKPCGFRLIS